ncbi:hypothetical protein [Halomonas sp. PR-M31]|uniref:hypothetical protein n=1 Tax=Halomonas sp. PR-M31 TaxID=1471202 RepID=UPI0006521375|nr:hypothetical protein [Halomonas sp. PR-M31]
MSNKLDSIVINNPQRRTWGYRLRDITIVSATVSLWILFVTQTYLTVTSSNFLAEQAYVLQILKLTAIDFVAVFVILHVWVLYERVLFRLRLRAYRRSMEEQAAQPKLEAKPAEPQAIAHPKEISEYPQHEYATR